jgi:hypothetical protein
MHIGQFVLSWTANLSFSRDEQILESYRRRTAIARMTKADRQSNDDRA